MKKQVLNDRDMLKLKFQVSQFWSFKILLSGRLPNPTSRIAKPLIAVPFQECFFICGHWKLFSSLVNIPSKNIDIIFWAKQINILCWFASMFSECMSIATVLYFFTCHTAKQLIDHLIILCMFTCLPFLSVFTLQGFLYFHNWSFYIFVDLPMRFLVCMSIAIDKFFHLLLTKFKWF